MIRVEHLVKKFGDTIVLNDLNFVFECGKAYGFVGYNGCGKTVLFKCICGLMQPDEGKIYIDNEPLGCNMLRDVGIIIEHPAFLSSKSGMKNLELLYMINHKRDRKYLEEVMESVGLDPKLKKSVKYYSLGMRQRLAIAQAIMENPRVLVLDEPMNGLDKKGVEDVRNKLLLMKKQGKIILLASHNKEDIEVICDEVYIMGEGTYEKISTTTSAQRTC